MFQMFFKNTRIHLKQAAKHLSDIHMFLGFRVMLKIKALCFYIQDSVSLLAFGRHCGFGVEDFADLGITANTHAIKRRERREHW